MAKTSPRNVGDLVFLESRRDLTVIIKTTASISSLVKSKMKLPGIYVLSTSLKT